MPIYLEFYNLIVRKDALNQDQYNHLKETTREDFWWEDDYLIHVDGSMGTFSDEQIARLTNLGLNETKINADGIIVFDEFCILGSASDDTWPHPCEWIDHDYLKEKKLIVRHIDDKGENVGIRSVPLGATSKQVAKAWGTVTFRDMRVKPSPNGEFYFNMADNGYIDLIDDIGMIVASYSIPKYAELVVKEEEEVHNGTLLYNWEERSVAIRTEFGGMATYLNFKEGMNGKLEQDSLTEFWTFTVSDDVATDNLPIIEIRNDAGDLTERYELSANCSIIFIGEAGDVEKPTKLEPMRTVYYRFLDQN